jgi:plastocyanin
MIRPMRPLAFALPLAVALVSCDGSAGDDALAAPSQPCSASTAAAVADVAVTAAQFIPFCARVAAGGQITFTNVAWEAHWVTADAGQPEPFDSGYMPAGHQFTHTFVTPGAEIRVHCRLHPEASGRIFVVP